MSIPGEELHTEAMELRIADWYPVPKAETVF